MSATGTTATGAEATRLTDLSHLLAGNAVVTVVAADCRHTLHFYRPNNGRSKGKVFCRLLTGPNNTADYDDVGEVVEGKLVVGGKFAVRDKKVLAHAALARWLVDLATAGASAPEGIAVYGNGCCLRCGRLLTATDNPYFPYLGPECGTK